MYFNLLNFRWRLLKRRQQLHWLSVIKWKKDKGRFEIFFEKVSNFLSLKDKVVLIFEAKVLCVAFISRRSDAWNVL
jgi:hypothetical protein